jgi:polyhydroxybutyrate depolymerase
MNGVTRRFEFVLPLRANHRLLPTVIELHGSGHFGADQLATSGFADLAQREGFAVCAPDARIPERTRPEWSEGRAWNVPGAPLVTGKVADDAPDDVAFVRALIALLIAEGIADPERIYLAGFSGGARLCSYLAGVLGERLAAAAMVAGLRVPPDCGVPLPPIVAIHSRADEINPYTGGLGPRWDLGIEETATAIAEREHLNGPAVTENARVVRRAYASSRGEERLVTYTLADAPHNWPGSRDPRHRFRYGQTKDLDATALFWSFFLERRAARMADR